MVIRQTTITILSITIFIIISTLLFSVVLYLSTIYEEHQHALKRRLLAKDLSEQIGEASNYLTDEARKFVISGNVQHLHNYWREIEVSQRRKGALDALKALGVPEEKFQLLKQAKQHSDNLMKVETRAMRLKLEGLGAEKSAMPLAVAAWQLNPQDKALSAPEKKELARQLMFNENYYAHKQRIMEPIKEFQKSVLNVAQHKVERTRQNLENAEILLFIISFIIPISVAAIFWLFRRLIISPIHIYTQKLENIAETEDLTLTPYGIQELQLLVQAFNQQIQKNQKLLKESDVSSQKLTAQNWLKSGQNQLNQALQGDQDMCSLAKNAIDFLTNYLEASIGLFYLLRPGKPAYLELVASYGYLKRTQLLEKFYVGEGLIGQAALAKQSIFRQHSPEEYHFIQQSNLSETIPRQVMILPFLYEQEVKGVLEIGRYELFTEVHKEFLSQTMPLIGIAINMTESREKTQALLIQTQAQAEQLRQQQEELRQKNEQAYYQQQELEQANNTLQTQQQELQAANEELQTQQEELQASNEELQTQQEELKETNKILERRSQDLEQQRQEIQAKNEALEKAQVAVEQKAREVEMASKYKSEFLANMSHELRTPLNAVLILSQMLAENDEGNLTEEQVDHIQTIYSAGSDLLTLINEILDLSKIEAGKIDIQPENFSLSELIKNSIEGKFQAIAGKKNLEFKVEIADTVDILYSDPLRIKQVINNFLSNAFKFTEQGHIILTARETSAEEYQTLNIINSQVPWVTISVADSGIGIPEDKQKLIFEAFKQADGTTSRKYGGTGLGLSISRQLVHLLGGEIRLQSQENAGSCFIAHIPSQFSIVNVSDNAPIPPLAEANIPPSPPTQPTVKDDRDQLAPQKKTLLIIEDDSYFLQMLIQFAQEQGFQCLAAQDGEQGLQLAGHYQPDAILLDVGLPVLDGWTVMEKLKESPQTRQIPVHFLSGHGGEDQQAKQKGALGFLLKPASIGELNQVFKKIQDFINKKIKKLLMVSTGLQKLEEIQTLIGHDQIEFTQVQEASTALETIQSADFDCIILDIDSPDNQVRQLLTQLTQMNDFTELPIILYAQRDLTAEEVNFFKKYSDYLTIKSVRTPNHLLEETSLFLHQLTINPPEEKQQILQNIQNRETRLHGKTLLLADDDHRNCMALKTLLEHKSLHVLIAHDGKEALQQLAQADNIDIILMDIMMPEMDGYQAIREIRQQPKFSRLPIIALTAKAMKEDRTKCIQAGANDYLTKPVDTQKLLSLLQVWLYQ